MRREFILPLVIGLVLGTLIMIFWQFNVRLNNQMSAMVQLEQATTQNSKNINDIVAFINQATGKTTGTGAETPAPSN